MAIRRWGDHMMLMTSLQYYIRNVGDQLRSTAHHISYRPTTDAMLICSVSICPVHLSVHIQHICTVCCVHASVLTLLLLHVLVLWTNMPSIVCYCLMLSCMSVIGEYMQCSSRNDSTFHVLHRILYFTRYSASLLISIHPTLNVSHTLYYS